MRQYDYLQSVKEDVREYIREHDIKCTTSNRDEIQERLYDECFVDDSVTGNASGSYTFITWLAEENLCHNMDLLYDALREFGCDISDIEKGAEFCDVTIRCYLLPQAIDEVLDEIEEDEEEN